MLYVEVDGKKVPIVIKYFNGGITVDNMKDAKKLQPDEAFWCLMMGVRMPDADPAMYKITDPKVFEYLTNYWVTKDLHERIVKKCMEIGIPTEHADDLAIPLSNFLISDRLPIDPQMTSRARDAQKLKDLFLEFEKNPFLRLTKLTVEYGTGPIWNENEKKLEVINQKRVSVKNEVILVHFISELMRLFKISKPFRNLIIDSDVLKYQDFSYPKNLTKFRNRHLVVIADYLLNVGICKTPTDASRKAAILLSVHHVVLSESQFNDSKNKQLKKMYDGYPDYVRAMDENAYVRSREEFEKPEKVKLPDEYKTYARYIGDIARKRYETLKKKKKKKVE
jgi:hypothetical protein